MIKNLYSIRDSKVGAYGAPVMFRNNSEAIRTMQDALSDQSVTFAKHPEDFSLWHVGTFDEETGKVTAVNEIVAKLVDLIPPK